MQDEPPTQRGSLARRLRQSGLGALCVTLPRTQVVQRRRVTLPGGPILYALGMLLPVLVFLIVLERAPRSPLSPPRSAQSAEQPGILRLEYRLPTTIATAENTEDLARIIMSEASPGVANTVESISVGYTVRNRMHHLGTDRVRDVWDAYAHHASATDAARLLAARVLEGTVADPSGGATHFYSPRSMPRQGDAAQGFDTGGGLEQTAGLSTRNYRPGWAALYDAIDVAGVRPSYYKFYRRPDLAVPQ